MKQDEMRRARRKDRAMETGAWGLARWLDTATRGIRFKPDRAAVRAELAAHLEDKRADLQRIFPDLSPRRRKSGLWRPWETRRNWAGSWPASTAACLPAPR